MVRGCASIVLVVLVVLGVAILVGDYRIPPSPPSIDNTFSQEIHPTPLEIGSYDYFGTIISRKEAEQMLATEEGRVFLSRENGAIEITQELIDLGREAFYLETFGNEHFLTDVVGVLDGPINLITVSRAILSLGGGHTTNLRIPVDETFTVGGRTWEEGSYIDTGMDVPSGYLLPLGIALHVTNGEVRAGVTCALCHVAVDEESGRIIEGATNVDIDAGLILALAPNSAALFRHTDIDPREMPEGQVTVTGEDGETFRMPDILALEDAVDEAILAWPPGTFDTTFDLVNNPTFIGPSFTFGIHPYGWNGFAAVGWFQGLSSLNNNVHAGTADVTGDWHLAGLMDMEPNYYMGVILQNASSDRYRVTDGDNPLQVLMNASPNAENPGVSFLAPMPDYPMGSVFNPLGTMAGTSGQFFAEEVNAMSAFQHSLAPPPNQQITDIEALQRGARVFVDAGCAECHSGRFFTNNQVIPLDEIGTNPSRAEAMLEFPEVFVEPRTYAPSDINPVGNNGRILEVPLSEETEEMLEIVYEQGGYKVMTLIGVYLHAPYLHEASIAAGSDALQFDGERYVIVDESQIGVMGTTERFLRPDPVSSLRFLIDRQLRQQLIQAYEQLPEKQRINVTGQGHEYWVDIEAGFTIQEQNDLILFLLSLDDNPEVLP
jgi:hypothetical protein